MDLRQKAFLVLQSAIEAVKAQNLIDSQVRLKAGCLFIGDFSIDLSEVKNLYIIGAGKASAFMAQALEKILGDRVSEGLVIVKYGHSAPCRKIIIREAGHPVLDEEGLQATKEMVKFAAKAGERDLVICLISGGGSALMEKLPPGISLPDIQSVFQSLLSCGATIEEFNVIRKHLSLIKGGQLAKIVSPAFCLSLIISDVIGDPLEAIASGPSAPDSTTFFKAMSIISKYQLTGQISPSVLEYLDKGIKGQIPETIKTGRPVFKNVRNIIIGNNRLALEAAQKSARRLGFETHIINACLQGEARKAAREIARLMVENASGRRQRPKPVCLLFGGETTVTIHGNGKGGRNQEFVLAALPLIKDIKRPYLLISCGTDGSDGPTDAAGALADREIWQKACEKKLDPLAYLKNNDAYNFFQPLGGLIKTGPTGANVMDIGIIMFI